MHRSDVRGADVIMKARGGRIASIGHDVYHIGTRGRSVYDGSDRRIGLFDALLNVRIAVVDVLVVVVIVGVLGRCRPILAVHEMVGVLRVGRHRRRRALLQQHS
jgi:hypothetical protein